MLSSHVILRSLFTAFVHRLHSIDRQYLKNAFESGQSQGKAEFSLDCGEYLIRRSSGESFIIIVLNCFCCFHRFRRVARFGAKLFNFLDTLSLAFFPSLRHIEILSQLADCLGYSILDEAELR